MVRSSERNHEDGGRAWGPRPYVCCPHHCHNGDAVGHLRCYPPFMTDVRRLSAASARRIALAAQGFADRRPGGRVTAAHVRRVLGRIGMLQLDSVNALVRSHYLPLFSRLGPYPLRLLDDYAYKRKHLFEYWGHAASLIPVEHYPLFRHRMAQPVRWGTEAFGDGRMEFVDRVLEEVREHGPIAVGELSEPGDRAGPWWGWGEGKLALEFLFSRGQVATAGRPAFTRVYDIAERVIPPQYRDAEPVSEEDARRELLLLAAKSLGVGTARDLADYYRLPVQESRQTLWELADAGTLEHVDVAGWKEPAYLHPEAHMARRVNARALLSPFDSLVWERARTERIFRFRYRIEIYTPEPKRVYGYYVLPFLLGEELVARVDLRSDRKSGRLQVRAAHAEPGADPEAIAAPLAEELRLMAQWLGLANIEWFDRGDLAPFLRPHL